MRSAGWAGSRSALPCRLGRAKVDTTLIYDDAPPTIASTSPSLGMDLVLRRYGARNLCERRCGDAERPRCVAHRGAPRRAHRLGRRRPRRRDAATRLSPRAGRTYAAAVEHGLRARCTAGAAPRRRRARPRRRCHPPRGPLRPPAARRRAPRVARRARSDRSPDAAAYAKRCRRAAPAPAARRAWSALCVPEISPYAATAPDRPFDDRRPNAAAPPRICASSVPAPPRRSRRARRAIGRAPPQSLSRPARAAPRSNGSEHVCSACSSSAAARPP